MGNDNNKIDETYTKHAVHIPESVSDKLYNSIVRIEKEKGDIMGTGFFVKFFIKNQLKHFLFTCHHVIRKTDINSKISIDIYYGKKKNEKKKVIQLDNEERFISYFDDEKDITLVEILERDNISEDKYLLTDLSYKYGYEIYKEGKFLLAGYPKDNIYEKERHISSGEIKSINGFEFEHTLDARNGSSGSPICLFENMKVIGIHKQGDKVEPINYGTFIGVIIDKLENEYKEIKKDKYRNDFSVKSYVTISEITEILKLFDSICKIYCEKIINGRNKICVSGGFFLHINNNNIPFNKCLITNNHFLDENDIEKNNNINVKFINENKVIKINEKRKKYTDKKLDYTCIEIFESDNIKKFIELYSNIKDINLYKNEEVIRLSIGINNDPEISRGHMISKEDNIICHNCGDYDYTIYGYPIIFRHNHYLIGLTIKGTIATNINSIINDIIIKSNNK